MVYQTCLNFSGNKKKLPKDVLSDETSSITFQFVSSKQALANHDIETVKRKTKSQSQVLEGPGDFIFSVGKQSKKNSTERGVEQYFTKNTVVLVKKNHNGRQISRLIGIFAPKKRTLTPHFIKIFMQWLNHRRPVITLQLSSK